MELISPLLSLLTEIGKIVNFENSVKIQQRIEELTIAYEKEVAKGPNRDDALVYSIRLELRNICILYSANLKGQTSKS